MTLYLIRADRHREGNPDRLEVPLPASDLVRLAGAKLEELSCTLRLTHEIKHLSVVLHDSPVGVVLADRRVDLEPARELNEKLDVLALVELAGELTLHL